MSDLTDNLFYPSAEYGRVYACRFWQKKKNIFSDEAHFNFGGFVSKQNCLVAFGAQKTHMHTLKSRLTQNESLFDADFSLEA